MTFDKNNLHENARRLALKGLAILPCESRGKRPLTAHGVTDATSDISQIDKWWRARPDANIGIACGARSGLFVVDIDGEDGEASMRQLEAEHGSLPATIEAITGRGRHVYFKLNRAMGNSAGRLGTGIDTRGDGGFVVAPPSVHSSGRRYEWSVDSTKLSAAPAWLYRLLETRTPATGLREKWHTILTKRIRNGERNDTMTRIAGKLFYHSVNAALVQDLIECVNVARCETPLSAAEIETIVVSVGRTHLRGGRT